MAVGAQEVATELIVVPPVAHERRWGRAPGTALLVLAAVIFLGYGARIIVAPFGDSHDGRNAAVWASGSKAIREEGPVASRLGAIHPEGVVYANHPPLIYLETALAEELGFSTTAASRAPAWLGSLLFLLLVARLLRDRGVGHAAAGMAVVLVATTPIFLVYGTMLDTPITSLPFAAGLLLLWERARAGKTVRPHYAGGLTVLTVLAGWQGMLLALLLGAWALVRLVRHTGRRELDVAFVAGAVLGVGLLLAWLLWAFDGTLVPLMDQFRFRTGQSTQPVTLTELVKAQYRYASALIGVIGVIALGGLVVAFCDRRLRGVAALAVGSTVPYTLLFRSGAVNHDYWN